MRFPVIQYRILTLMLVTAVVALMAALNLLLSPFEWIAFFVHAIVDACRSGVVGGLTIVAIVAAFVMAIKGLFSHFGLARRKAAGWLIDRFGSRQVIVLSRWLCGRVNTVVSIVERADQLYVSGKFEDCITLLGVAISVDPTQAILWHYRALCHFELKNMHATIDDSTQVLLRDPGITEASWCRGYAFLSLKNFRAALEDLAKVECNEQRFAHVAMCRGWCHEELGHWAAADADYKLALGLDAENTEAMRMAARFYSACPVDEFRDGAEAIVLATKVCKCSEFKEWISLSILASAYAELGDFNTALVYARRTLELAPPEEKAERAQRMEQFERGVPYRLPVPVTSVEQ